MQTLLQNSYNISFSPFSVDEKSGLYVFLVTGLLIEKNTESENADWIKKLS